jgi:hydroxymethylpyrimidine/phosphomethylpyrimidine kinase
MTRRIPTAMTIAGSDSGGGAGVQADLKTFAALGVYGTNVITAVTAQNTTGVTCSEAVSADVVTAQMEAVAGDIEIHATKTGMLATAAIVEAVAATVEELDLPLLVVDPVMISKGGNRLLDADAVDTLRTELLPLALVVTPNIPEAEVLADMKITVLADAREAARRIHRLGPRAVVVKGGHSEGAEIVDVLFDGEGFTEFRSPRIDTRNTHGTGCTFASAIAAYLARGLDLAAATGRAQEYVAGAIRHGLAIGRGHGPLDHFWATRQATAAAPRHPLY